MGWSELGSEATEPTAEPVVEPSEPINELPVFHWPEVSKFLRLTLPSGRIRKALTELMAESPADQPLSLRITANPEAPDPKILLSTAEVGEAYVDVGQYEAIKLSNPEEVLASGQNDAILTAINARIKADVNLSAWRRGLVDKKCMLFWNKDLKQVFLLGIKDLDEQTVVKEILSS